MEMGEEEVRMKSLPQSAMELIFFINHLISKYDSSAIINTLDNLGFAEVFKY